jgi:glycosyltransferase 2 family protein
MRFFRHPAVVAAAPWTFALATLALGVLLITSGARPSFPARFIVLSNYLPAPLIEVSHFVSSVLGLVLVMLAFGLRARLDAAWAGTLVTLIIAAPLSVAKGFVFEETVVLLALAAALAPFNHAFPRKARLSRMEVTPGWLLSAAAFVVGAGLIGIWSFQNVDYGDMPWWQVMADEDAARALRAWAGAALALFAVGVWRLMGSAAPPPIVGEADPEFDRVRAVLAKAETSRPTSNLALLGDKRFLFSTTGESFLMFGVRGRSWVALGSTVGRRDERLELLWRFRELADSHAARPGFYNLEADDLPDIVELGFAIQKMGEGAVAPLDSFTIEGTKRGNLRRAWRRAKDDGATFEIIQPADVAPILGELRRISDAWLETHAGGEKSFALGGFYERYIQEFPAALVRWEGQIIAFATLWTVASRQSFSIDLMRFVPEGPPRIMDYLFVELIRWGQAEGYGAFDFGMAPLSGLDDRPLAPALSRVGRLIYDRGEEIYNFQGVRHYKSKYDPTWQPRFVAAPRSWNIPRMMADVGLLASGGVAGLTKRPKKAEE